MIHGINTQLHASLVEAFTPRGRVQDSHGVNPLAHRADAVDLSLEAGLLKRVSVLEGKLDKIFGVRKQQLTESEKKQESQIMGKIDAIFKKSETVDPTKKANKIFEQIDKIFEDGTVSKSEEKELGELHKRLEKFFAGPQAAPQLSDKDQKEFDKLSQQLDKLYGLKTPSKDELVTAERIMKELDLVFSGLDNIGSHAAFGHQQEVAGLFNEFSTDTELGHIFAGLDNLGHQVASGQQHNVAGLIKEFDKDQDGKLNLKEALRSGAPDEKTFKAADTDQDGFVSRAELETFFEEPSAHANALDLPDQFLAALLGGNSSAHLTNVLAELLKENHT